jgi:hypothetical protein
MKNLLRRHNGTETASSQEDWPHGTDDPESAFYVPDELRSFYVVDLEAENALLGRDATNVATGLKSEDHAIAESKCTPATLAAHGVKVIQSRDLEGKPTGPVRYEGGHERYASVVRSIAAGITHRDRQIYRHNLRLGEAARRKERAASIAEDLAEQRLQQTCELCQQVCKSTSRRVYASTGRVLDARHGDEGTVTLKVCSPCNDVVGSALIEAHASQTRDDGTTVHDAARAMIAPTRRDGTSTALNE